MAYDEDDVSWVEMRVWC